MCGQVAQRHLQRARRQPKFGGRVADRLQARAVGRGVTKLPDPRQADLAAEMPADHAEARGTAIHLVDLLDMIDLADPLFPFPEKALSSANGAFCRPPREGAVLSTPSLSCAASSAGSISVAKSSGTRASVFAWYCASALPPACRTPGSALQIADRVGFEREQTAIGDRLNGGGAGRAIQDRELAEEIAVAIESEILLRAIIGLKSTRPPFLENEHRAGRIALRMMALPFGNSTGVSFSTRLRSAGTGSRPKLLNS